MDTFERLTEVMIGVFDDDDLVASPEMTAANVEGWDSLAHIRFMLAVEREFDVKFSASQMASFKTVGDLAEALGATSRAV